MLNEYRTLLAEFNDTLRVFRSWNNIWKASVLTATDLVVDVDLTAEKQAGESWENLLAIHTRLAELHRTLGIPASLPELPFDEWEEVVVPLAAQQEEKQ